MATETERKFLVISDSWKAFVKKSAPIVQAYLCKDKARTVRIRIAGDQAYITIKGAPAENGFAVPEFEYAIPVLDATALLKLCLPGAIIKTRYIVPYAGKNWEVDVFDGENAGLIVAEIELDDENERFEKPDWLGMEVTHDPRYKNAVLADRPYLSWKN